MNVPMTIEGTLTMISERMLITLAIVVPRAYSARKVPPSTPTGTPINVANNVIINWPTKAFLRPPPETPTGAGSLTNKERFSAAMPCTSTSPRIKTSQNNPKKAEKVLRDRAITPSIFLICSLFTGNTSSQPSRERFWRWPGK